MTSVTAPVVTWPPRVLGVLPLAVFALHWYHHWQAGTPANMWWMCGVSLVALGIGMLARIADLVRVATVALLFGLPLWLMEIVLTGHVTVQSITTHVVGLGIGLWAMNRVRASRSTWWKSTIYFLAVQQGSRWFSRVMNNCTSSRDTCSTGHVGPQLVNPLGFVPITACHCPCVTSVFCR